MYIINGQIVVALFLYNLGKVPQKWASQVALVVKNLPFISIDTRDAGLIPGLERSPGGRQGNPLQYPHLENPMDRGAWWATAHRVSKCWTRWKRLSVHTPQK